MIKRNLMFLLGLAALALGTYGVWDSFQRDPASPLDVVDVPDINLDDNENFIPLIQPQQIPADHAAPDVILDEETFNRAAEIRLARDSEPDAEKPGYVPDRLVIESIGVDAPVVPISRKEVDYKKQVYDQWLVPTNGLVGWHDTSALLGKEGNTVFNGHHNAYGKVFKDLAQLDPGDLIQVYSGAQIFEYLVGTKMLLPERNQPIEIRLENARWILPSNDERLTLITCWPANGNTHRVIVVAFPRQPTRVSATSEAPKQEIDLSTPAPAPTSTPFVGLKLAAICSSQKEFYFWQVENSNPYDVNFEYVVDSGYSGVGKVPAGAMAEIQTPASEGKILLLYSNGVLQASRSARTRCE